MSRCILKFFPSKPDPTTEMILCLFVCLFICVCLHVLLVSLHVHVMQELCCYNCIYKYTYASKKSVRKVSNGWEITFELRVKCICSVRVLLLEVHNRAAKRISATQTTFQRFCRPMSPLSLYLIASLNSSSFCLASLLCVDRSIAHAIICNIVT